MANDNADKRRRGDGRERGWRRSGDRPRQRPEEPAADVGWGESLDWLRDVPPSTDDGWGDQAHRRAVPGPVGAPGPATGWPAAGPGPEPSWMRERTDEWTSSGGERYPGERLRQAAPQAAVRRTVARGRAGVVPPPSQQPPPQQPPPSQQQPPPRRPSAPVSPGIPNPGQISPGAPSGRPEPEVRPAGPQRVDPHRSGGPRPPADGTPNPGDWHAPDAAPPGPAQRGFSEHQARQHGWVVPEAPPHGGTGRDGPGRDTRQGPPDHGRPGPDAAPPRQGPPPSDRGRPGPDAPSRQDHQAGPGWRERPVPPGSPAPPPFGPPPAPPRQQAGPPPAMPRAAPERGGRGAADLPPWQDERLATPADPRDRRLPPPADGGHRAPPRDRAPDLPPHGDRPAADVRDVAPRSPAPADPRQQPPAARPDEPVDAGPTSDAPATDAPAERDPARDPQPRPAPRQQGRAAPVQPPVEPPTAEAWPVAGPEDDPARPSLGELLRQGDALPPDAHLVTGPNPTEEPAPRRDVGWFTAAAEDGEGDKPQAAAPAPADDTDDDTGDVAGPPVSAPPPALNADDTGDLRRLPISAPPAIDLRLDYQAGARTANRPVSPPPAGAESAPPKPAPAQAGPVDADVDEPQNPDEPGDDAPTAPISAPPAPAPTGGTTGTATKARTEPATAAPKQRTSAEAVPQPVPPQPVPPQPADADADPQPAASPDTVLPVEGTAAGAATALRAPTMLNPVVTAETSPAPEGPEEQAKPADPEQVLAAYPWRFHHETLRELVEDPEELRAIRDRLTDKLDTATDNPARARLLSLRAVVSRILGDLGKALSDGKLALAHAEATGELRRIAIAQARLAHVHQWRGDYAEADRLNALANSPELPDRLRATMHEHAGRSCYDQGRYMEACNHFEKALDLRKVDDPELIARTEVALDAVFTKVAANGWGPYSRTRDEILRVERAPVATFSEDAQRWGYADAEGELAVPAEFADVQPFREAVAWVRRPETEPWELIDESGAVLIGADAGYLGVGSFSDGLAWVSHNGRGTWIAIDRANNVVIPTGYEDVRPFRRGVAAVKRGAWGAVDKAGRTVVPTQFTAFATALTDGRYVDGFTDEGLAVVDAGGRKGVVDRTGRVLVPPRYPALVIHPVAFLFGSGAGRWGALDRAGEPLIEPEHQSRADVMEEIDRLLADTRPVL